MPTSTPEPAPSDRLPFRSKLLILTVLLIGIWIPLQFWHGVWFGRELTDAQMDAYLSSDSKYRSVQHALSQISERIVAGDSEIRKWYPRVADLVDHPSVVLRAQAAWVMGQDNTSEIFHKALLRNLKDPSPLVRRNSALSLVKFRDRSAASELRQMLSPWPILSPVRGTVDMRARLQQWVHSDVELATITASDGDVQPVRSELRGQVSAISVKHGETVDEDQQLLVLSPDPEHAWEALRGLFLIGRESDLPWVEPFLDDPRYNEELQAQAKATAEALKTR